MAWQDFIKAIRQDEEDEKRRDQQGGVGNRIFGFLDDAIDTGSRAIGKEPDSRAREEADRRAAEEKRRKDEEEKRRKEAEAKRKEGSDEESVYVGYTLGEGKNKTIFGHDASWLIPGESNDKVREVKVGRKFKNTEKGFLESFDKVGDEQKKIYLSGLQDKANEGDDDAKRTLETLRNKGRLEGDVFDFIEGSNERFIGGTQRGLLRTADLLLPGKNTLNLEGTADSLEKTRQVTDAGKAGEKFGTAQKGAWDVASLVIPATKADKITKGTKVVQNLEKGDKAARAAGFIAKTVPGSLVGSGVDILQERGRGNDVNAARSVGVGLAADLLSPIAARTAGKALRYVDDATGNIVTRKASGLVDLLKRSGTAADDIVPANSADEFVDAARVSSDNTLNRPSAQIQKRIEDALNSGDEAGAQKIVDALPDGDVKAGMQATIDSITGTTEAGARSLDPATGEVITKPTRAAAAEVGSPRYVASISDDLRTAPNLDLDNVKTVKTRELQLGSDALGDGTVDRVPKGANKSQFINDVKPGNGERQFGLLKTTQESEQLADPTKEAISQIQPQTYTQMNSAETLNRAREIVTSDFNKAKDTAIKALDAGRWDDESSSLTIELIRDANSRGDYDFANEVLEKAAPLARNSGQANVLWRSLVNQNTPEGMVRFAEKTIDKANDNMGFLTKTFRGGKKFSLDDEARQFILDRTAAANKLADGPEKDAITEEIMDKIADQIPPGATEVFDAYRYQNMLAGPRTQARNLWGNFWQAQVTRPATLGTQGGADFVKAGLFGKDRKYYVKNVVDYEKGMLNSLPEALESFKRGWAGDIQQPDLKNVRAYTNKKMPKALTVVGRAMEGADRFFQTLIENGEYAVKKANGASDDVARKAAKEMAQYSVFRSATDATNKTGQGALLSKIDAVTDTISNIGQKHKAVRWFVPFIQTPMNITKQMVEMSPAGWATVYKATGERRDEQIAKAMLGSVVTGIGAMMALEGRTTWSVPSDPAEREAFYSSGKKPYSININGKWVPMIYSGPFAYALGLAAAVKDANDKGSLEDSAFERIGSIIAGQANFFTQQTYLQGMNNFIDAITGEGDQSLGSSLAFTAGQVIPLQGLSRYVNSVLDPVVRKKKGIGDTIASDIPVIGAQYSKNNQEPYTNTFTGEETRRNFSDYLAPYSMGSEASNPEDKDFQTGVGEFYKIRGQVRETRTRANDYITEALDKQDYGEAYNAALDYNDWLAEQFSPWNEQYGQYVSEDLQDMYDRLKISITGLRRRGRNALDNQDENVLDYRR